ncbi:phage terminase large subunit [Larkinella sp. C7]|uniref:phage terminase large subunit n=1 Tax=Larkinella sp. C7 TaxID=2576607 RepID=UPI00111121BA|nr:phage terminase large subunit [Larkinella sp. C7]
MTINFLPASIFKGYPVPDGCFVVPDVFIPHLFDKSPVQIWYGSRFSAKSYTKAQELIGRCCGKEYFRGIYARQNREDVKNSQFQLFKDTIKKRPWLDRQFDVRDSDYVIENKITGNKLIPGSFDQPQKIMSIADPTDIWVEEPITRKGEIKRTDFFDMFGSLRNPYGVQPRFHFTFNPISIYSWIYTDFFEKKSIPSNRVLANYDDNPFCPQSAFDFFSWLQDVDPERYLIDAKGKWGVPKPDNPYFHKLNPAKHFAKVQYDPRLPVYLSFDFNVRNSCIVRQKQDGSPKYLKEFYMASGAGFDLESLCREIAFLYGKNMLMFTGDGSGNSRSAYTTGNMSAWQLIEGYMKKYGAPYTDWSAVPRSNVETDNSRFICNALINEFKDFTIDPEGCPVLVSDVLRMKAATDGKLDKADCNKHDYGHVGDCLRYDLANFEFSTFQRLGNGLHNSN